MPALQKTQLTQRCLMLMVRLCLDQQEGHAPRICGTILAKPEPYSTGSSLRAIPLSGIFWKLLCPATVRIRRNFGWTIQSLLRNS